MGAIFTNLENEKKYCENIARVKIITIYQQKVHMENSHKYPLKNYQNDKIAKLTSSEINHIYSTLNTVRFCWDIVGYDLHYIMQHTLNVVGI